MAVPVGVGEARSSSPGPTSRSTTVCTSSGSCSSASVSRSLARLAGHQQLRLSRWVVDPLASTRPAGSRARSAASSTRGPTPRTDRPRWWRWPTRSTRWPIGSMSSSRHNAGSSPTPAISCAPRSLRSGCASRITLGPESAATRDAALDEVARLTRLVDGLLSLARAEGARPVREPVSVTAVLAERHEAWLPLATEQRVGLAPRRGRRPRPSTAQLVPGHLEQILDNLIDNALDVSPAESTVTLRSERVGGYVEIHVIDEGPGMSEEERRDAFAPFWQSATGRRAGSSGLGLAIAQQLAWASQGSLRLDRSARGGIDAVVRFRADEDVKGRVSSTGGITAMRSPS